MIWVGKIKLRSISAGEKVVFLAWFYAVWLGKFNFILNLPMMTF